MTAFNVSSKTFTQQHNNNTQQKKKKKETVSMEVNKPYLKPFRDRIQKIARIIFTENEWTDFTVNLDSLNCALKANLKTFLSAERKPRDFTMPARGRGRGSFRGRYYSRDNYSTPDNRFSYSGGYSKKKYDPDAYCDRCLRLAFSFVKI